MNEEPLGLSLLLPWGEAVRVARRSQKVSAAAAAQAAGISRTTLHRIEQGEAGVSAGAWAAVSEALGLKLQIIDPRAATKPSRLPKKVRLGDFPELRKLAWQVGATAEVTPKQALDLYERNWRHLDRASLSEKESEFIRLLASTIGGGRLLV